jgi:hypothetical protein
LRNDFGDFASVIVPIAFMLDYETEFKTDFRYEFVQVKVPLPHLIKVPLPHLIDIGQRSPNFFHRRVVRTLNHNRNTHPHPEFRMAL